MKDKKKLFIIIGVVFAIVLSIVLIFVLTNKKKGSNDVTTTTTQPLVETHEMYVKINPLVKLVFNTTYEMCTDHDGKQYPCGDGVDEIVDYELVNNDAKEIYNDLDFTGKKVNDVIVMLCDTARENKVAFEKIDITSDYNNINYEEIKTYLKDHSKYHTQVEVYVEIKEHINKEELMTQEELNEEKKFAITFNSDGGTKVASQLLKEGEKVKKPKDPTKAGYKFLYWVVDNQEYNFDSEVTTDLKIKARWELVDENKTTTTTTTTSGPIKTTKQTTADKYQSTYDRINLNENLLVFRSEVMTGCWEVYFASNYKEVYPEAVGNNDFDFNYIADDYSDLHSLFESRKNQLLFDTQKEQQAISYLNELKIIKKGVKSIDYKLNDHGLTYYISYLYFSSGDEDSDYNNSRFVKEMNSHIDDKVYGAHRKVEKLGFLSPGGCGGWGEDTPTILTEALCEEYHLTCDRW